MAESQGPVREREIGRALARLSAAVDRIAAEPGSGGAGRADAAPKRARKGAKAPPAAGEDPEARMARLDAENRALRETLAQARAKAERLRSRLAVVEDEV